MLLKMLVEGGGIPKAGGICYLGHGQIGFLEQLTGDFYTVPDQIFLGRQSGSVDK